jgi:superoxide dismutase, Cu-Zn family
MNSGQFSVAVAATIACGLFSAAAPAADIEVTVNKVDAKGVGEAIGTILFRDTSDLGLLIVPRLEGLKPGAYGFHIHENPDCAPHSEEGKPVAAGAAGDHYDPDKTGRHAGPVGDGHLGDLPELLVGPDGHARMAVVAPRLQVPDLIGRTVMIHEGGDNYSDQPKPLGGGGARVACGVINVDAL